MLIKLTNNFSFTIQFQEIAKTTNIDSSTFTDSDCIALQVFVSAWIYKLCSIPGNRIITDESTSIASHPKLPRVIFTDLEDVEIPIQVPFVWREKNLFHL